MVVGAGLAGLRAAEELRDLEFSGEVTVVGEEDRLPYNRPPLSKQILGGAMEPERCFFKCEELDVQWRLGDAAEALDTGARKVRLAGGGELPYDGLVIATGRRAREWPDLPELKGFHTLRTLDDCLALREAVKDGPRVAIVGAGFVGCEVAATLRKGGVEEVALIDIAPHPMPALGPEVGERAARLHADRGVKLHLQARVEGFEGKGSVEVVRLEDGTRVGADVVLIALGSLPNSEWLEGSGLELCRGAVLCDEHCVAVGTDDVVAAGDVAAWPHPHAGGPISIEHWTHAAEMARAAVANLLAGPGERTPFVPAPTFWSDQYETTIKQVGLFHHATSASVVEEDADEGRLVLEGRVGDELVGAVILNKNKAFIGYKRQLTSALADAER